jgi:hypothetical protein
MLLPREVEGAHSAAVLWLLLLSSLRISSPSRYNRPVLVKRINHPVHRSVQSPASKMFATLLDIDLQTDYATPYEANRAAYLADAEALKKATGPYKAARDAYVAATATFTKSLYE